MSTANSFDQFWGDFREIILSATARLRDMTPEESRLGSSEDGWAPIEILGHLIDSARHHLDQIFDRETQH